MIDDDHLRPVASTQDGTHPRPQLLRARWVDLSGPWRFAFDDEDAGLRERWWLDWPGTDTEIAVPYPPESPASGVNDTTYHHVAWYRRTLTEQDLAATGTTPGDRLMLRFGAVDFRCHVWVDGHLVGTHEGGHTPFSFDITDVLDPGEAHVLVVRAEDDPHDVSQPRGKQDWREQPHVIWYHRTSGIWQPVWLESVPAVGIDSVHWTATPGSATVTAELRLTAAPSEPVPVRITLTHGGTELAATATMATRADVTVVLSVPALSNGQAYEELLWSPEHPHLVDALLDVGEDRASSYVGIRTAEVARGHFLLNDRPYYVRSVLNQGYWPQSHLAAPSADALRAEAQLIKDLGFNATRVHQKFEDPRFLYWTDRLGLLVWGEAPASFTYSTLSVERTVDEWLAIVHRDFSHPSIVTWVPLNESWGVQHIAREPRMQRYARSLVDLTKALDPTRPVVSNDGWEQVETDIVAIHDYAADPDVVAARYRDRAAIDAMVAGIGPAGRRLVLSGDIADAPVMLTEFGGISYDLDAVDDAWGYSAATSPGDFAKRLQGLLGAVHASGVLAGFCYTQLADTLQETNGLVTADRVPKLPVEELRAIMTGD
ncbi:glycoside hydrolase family 2 protein [Cellulomonas edaphi]|uniref:Glycoside hydrolase family 2 TIM barrel-domain containing protein n=1 Tax=Cellulomonas edaphi TaxID=3053468 RepID=A0ABT7S7N3_9CELL|nr:sugar-binding domain-containing protein [Cellulomons edaphi]MDM7831625.1 glycoside hydrolase family 2 TIM barrel-domain containing protein [Cellulomons edaphi]